MTRIDRVDFYSRLDAVTSAAVALGRKQNEMAYGDAGPEEVKESESYLGRWFSYLSGLVEPHLTDDQESPSDADCARFEVVDGSLMCVEEL